MLPHEFIIWLNGFLDSADNETISKKQLSLIRKMLGKVEFDEYIEQNSIQNEMPSHSIWQTSTTAHSTIDRIVMEYTEN